MIWSTGRSLIGVSFDVEIGGRLLQDRSAPSRPQSLIEATSMALDRDAIYFARLGQRYGPVDVSAVRDLLEEGKLGADDHIWDPDLDDWVPVRRYPFLFSSAVPEAVGVPGVDSEPAMPPPIEAIAESAESLYREAPGLPYGGFGHRAAAWIIDLLVLAVPEALIIYWIMTQMGLDQSALTVLGEPSAEQDALVSEFYQRLQLATLVMQGVYWTLMESSVWQATVGKRAMGLVVTDTHGHRLGIGRAFLRFLGRVLCGMTLGTGYLLVLITSRRQGLHDLLARTIVVRR
jgi:uncharacterized RDD family membrane protein YckC